jgi:pilus assembly protein CpaC
MSVRSRPPHRGRFLPFGFARPWLRVVALLLGVAAGSPLPAQPPGSPRPTLTLDLPSDLVPSLPSPAAVADVQPPVLTPDPLPELPRPTGEPKLVPDETLTPGQVQPVQLPPVPVPVEKSRPAQPAPVPEFVLPRLPAPPALTPVYPIGLPKARAPASEVPHEPDPYVKQVVDPQNTLEVARGHTRMIVLKEAAARLRVADEKVAGCEVVSPTELALAGREVGSTMLNLWFADSFDPDRVKLVSYLVRVGPDPEVKARAESACKALAAEINHTFPDSQVSLAPVGDKVAVSGQCKDVNEAAQILRIVRTNAPAQSPNPSGEVTFAVHATVPETPPEGPTNLAFAAGPDVINLLRVPGEQQVMLKVVVAEVDRAAARSIGVRFCTETGGLTVLGADAGGKCGGPVLLDGCRIAPALGALRNLNYARSLAEPNLVTANGQTACFHAGGQFPVPLLTPGLEGVSFVPFGVQLSFTPLVTDRDRVRLCVAAEVSTRDESAGTFVGNSGVPGLQTRNFKTTVELREGQTLAVAGLIRNTLEADSSRMPLLSEIPLFGRLLGFDHTAAGERELVVLVTPELVHPLEPCEVPALPGAELFEPNDLEFYLCGKLESERGEDFRSPVHTSPGRLLRCRQCDDLFLIGPQGCSDVR